MERSVVASAFKLPLAQLPRVFFHATLLALIIASFWVLDSVKDPLLSLTVGMHMQPAAKLLSLLATLVTVLAYDALAARVSKATLFYAVLSLFGVLFLVLAALLSHPTIGLRNPVLSSSRLVGWAAYVSIECFGSLLVALFWSFTNASMDVYLAKASYGVIISAAQVGAVLGSSLATLSARVGIPALVLLSALAVLATNLLVKLYGVLLPANMLPAAEETGRRRDGACAGLAEGAALVGRHRYVRHLLWVTLLAEVLLALLDYKLKRMGADRASLSDEGTGFVLLLGRFGQLTNLLSFLVAFFCFSALVDAFGVRVCLTAFPLLLAAGTALLALCPQLWLVFLVVSALKALTFSLFDPLKEVLYVPTSDAIKFRAASWIEVFGARLAKALGSLLNGLLQRDVHAVNPWLLALGLGLGALLTHQVWELGGAFDELIEDGRVVGLTQPRSFMDEAEQSPDEGEGLS